MASSYQDIADLTAQMVANKEMTPDEQFQVHRALSQKGYGPGAPAPPQPEGLAPPAPQAPPLPGMLDLGYALKPLGDFAKAGYDRMVGGAEHMAQPGLEPKLQGTSDVIRGTGQMLAPSALPLATLAGPVALGSGLLGGYAGSKAADEVSSAAHLSPGAQALLEDIGGFAGGAGTNALLSRYAPAAGAALQDAAKTQYARVLNATTKANKATSAQIVPGLLDRGVSAGSAKGLLSKFQTQRDAAGQTLDDLWANIPKGTSVPLNPILDAMDKHASESFLSETGNPLSDQADQGIKVVQGLGQRLADESTVDPKTGERVITASALRRYRQEWDRITNKANGFTSTLDDATSGGAHNIGGDAARASINAIPGINDANQEYGFWKDASRVMGDTMQRRQGQAVPLGRKLAKYAGMGGGYAAGGPTGAAAMGAAMNGLETAGASVPWNTNMARAKYGLGGLLQSGQPQQVPYWIPGLLSATRP